MATWEKCCLFGVVCFATDDDAPCCLKFEGLVWLRAFNFACGHCVKTDFHPQLLCLVAWRVTVVLDVHLDAQQSLHCCWSEVRRLWSMRRRLWWKMPARTTSLSTSGFWRPFRWYCFACLWLYVYISTCVCSVTWLWRSSSLQVVVLCWYL
jgi:hypothetical protein